MAWPGFDDLLILDFRTATNCDYVSQIISISRIEYYLLIGTRNKAVINRVKHCASRMMLVSESHYAETGDVTVANQVSQQ